MAGLTQSMRQQWLKAFPPVQQKALQAAVSQNQLQSYKLGTDSVTSSTALVADSELTVPYVAANVPYLVTGQLIVTCAAAGNINFDLNAGGATIAQMSIVPTFYNAAGAPTNGAVQTALNTGANGGTTNQTICVEFWGVVNFATPGSFGLRFAQQASSATATTTGPSSFILMEAIGTQITS